MNSWLIANITLPLPLALKKHILLFPPHYTKDAEVAFPFAQANTRLSWDHHKLYP